MNYWKIKVLYYGKITLPKGAMTPGLDPDLVYESPYLGFLLQKDGRNILVDTGIASTFIVNGKAWGGFPAEGGKEYLLKAIKDAGITPEEIDTVLFTHLHNDHAAYCDLFAHANLICQRDEWANLCDPLPAQNIRGDYDPALLPELRKMKNLFRVDGDFQLTDGITLYKTPGHTKGSQTIAVTTKEGIKAIVGDHFHLSCMAFPQMTEMMDMNGKKHKITPAPAVYGPTIPSSLVYDYYAYYDSTYKIKAIVTRYEPSFIICGHEPSLLVTGA